MNNTNRNKDSKESKNENFFINEQKERAKISASIKEFKKNIDSCKSDVLKCIEKEKEMRAIRMKDELAEIDAALSAKDSERIKAALKNMKF